MFILQRPVLGFFELLKLAREMWLGLGRPVSRAGRKSKKIADPMSEFKAGLSAVVNDDKLASDIMSYKVPAINLAMLPDLEWRKFEQILDALTFDRGSLPGFTKATQEEISQLIGTKVSGYSDKTQNYLRNWSGMDVTMRKLMLTHFTDGLFADLLVDITGCRRNSEDEVSARIF